MSADNIHHQLSVTIQLYLMDGPPSKRMQKCTWLVTGKNGRGQNGMDNGRSMQTKWYGQNGNNVWYRF